MRSLDTTPEAYAVQLAAYRSMSPAERVDIAAAMSEEMFEVAAAGIRTRHPDYGEREVAWALHRLRLGDAMFMAVWPSAPLLDP